MEPFLLIVELCNDFESANSKEVKDTLLQNQLVVFGVDDLDDPDNGLSVLSLHVVEAKDLLEEISGLPVGQVAQAFLVEGIVEHLDVVETLLELLPADLLDSLLVVVKDDGEEDASHKEDSSADEGHEEDDRVPVGVVGWHHKVWEVLSREQNVELPVRFAEVIGELISLNTRVVNEARKEGKVEEESEDDGQGDEGVFQVDHNQGER